MSWNGLSKFENLTPNEKKEMLAFLNKNRTRATIKKGITKTKNSKLKDILHYYLPYDWKQNTPTLFDD